MPRLSSTQLKWIALITMLIDHIGIIFLQETPFYDLFRIIGRLSFPLFAWQLSISWEKTRSPLRLTGLLFLFVLISQIPYYLAFQNNKYNIFLLFVLAAPGLQLLRWKQPYLAGLFFLVAGLFAEGNHIPYGWYGISTIAAFAYAKDSFTWLLLCALALMVFGFIYNPEIHQWAAVLSTPLILLYDGSRGHKPMRWLFYAFYPVHLVGLALLRGLLY